MKKQGKKIIFIALLSVLMQGCWETQKGEKIGTLVKVAKEGVIFGTWEAELIRGGMNNGSGAFGKAFYFTIENLELLPIAIKALDEQKEVRIKYHKEGLVMPGRAESNGYFLDEIKIVS